MTSFAAVMVLMLGARDVSLTLAPALPCIAGPRLSSALEAGGLRVVDVPTASTMVVTLSHRRHQLKVRARIGNTALERAVPLGYDNCEAVEKVVTTLITVWAESQQPAMPARSHQPSESRNQKPTPDDEPPVTAVHQQAQSQQPTMPARSHQPSESRNQKPPPDEESSVTAEPQPADTPPLVFDSAPIQPPAVTRPFEPIEVISEAPLRQPPTAERNTAEEPVRSPPLQPFQLEIGAFGGIGSGPTPSISAASMLQFGLWRGHWGLALDGGVESAHQGTLDAVKVAAAFQWLTLSARFMVQLFKSLALDVGLGIRGWRLAASAEGVDVNTPASIFTAGPMAAVGVSWHLAGPFYVHARPFIGLRSKSYRLTVDPLGPVLALTPWSYGALAGIFLRFGA